MLGIFILSVVLTSGMNLLDSSSQEAIGDAKNRAEDRFKGLTSHIERWVYF